MNRTCAALGVILLALSLSAPGSAVSTVAGGGLADRSLQEANVGNDPADLTPTPAPVPEPATMILLGTGLVGLAAVGRRKFGT